MGETSFIKSGLQGAWLEHPRLAAHATSAAPVWLWSPDGARVLWANPVACAAFGVETPGELASRTFAPDAPVRLQVARLAATLPQGGAARLERLRGFASHGPHLLGRPLVCSCALFRLDHVAGVLVTATEAAGPALSLAERVRRLDLPPDIALAAFAPDGGLLFATPEGQRRLDAATTIGAIAGEALAATAISAGGAAGATSVGPMTLRRLGSGASMVLLGRFDPAATAPEAAATEPPWPSAGGTTAGEEAEATPSFAPEEQRRRHPLRFVWQMDADGRFTLGSDEFTEIIGTRTAIALGRPWQEINAALGLDPAGHFAAATATRETWSNVTISWPIEGSGQIEGSDQRLDVELSGLPAFDRGRAFLGYRGFGVCRDIDRIEQLRSMRRLALFAPAPPRAEAPPPEPPSRVVTERRDEAGASLPVAPNVVPFPSPAGFGDAKPTEHKSPALSPGEHVAFRELARQLAARLQDGDAAQEHGNDHAKAPPAISTAGHAVAAEAGSAARMSDDTKPAVDDHALLNRLPVGILVYRLDELLFANRAFLAMTGYPDVRALAGAGGLDVLFVDAGFGGLADSGEGGQRLAIATRSGNQLPVEGRLFAIHWNGEPAFAVLLAKSETSERIRTVETALRAAETEVRELRTMLEAQVQRVDAPAPAQPARPAAADKSEALAKLCHDARTPLNSILGFCDILLEQRYGPIGNDRYRHYVGDVRRAGADLMALLLDAVDLANIEAGTFRLTPSPIRVNDVVNECVAEMQPEAKSGHVIVRTSLSPSGQRITADPGAVRQIVANLLGYAIKGSRPGGQVIVSTGLWPDGGVVLRLRDNGDGLSEKAIESAMQPAGPQATTLPFAFAGSTLPLTKALAEACGARFKITSRPREGSLYELTFAADAEVAP